MTSGRPKRPDKGRLAPPRRPLTAAVIGGGLGGRLSLDALLASDRFEAVAVADIDARVREDLGRRYPAMRVYADHTQLIDTELPDVVCVSTYPPSHEDVALAAIRARPRGILVEKPLGPTTASGARILAAVRDAAIPMVVPHGLLVNATACEVMDRVRAGAIGDVAVIEIRTTGWDIINAGIHWLDLCLELLAPDGIGQVLARCDTSTRTFRDGMQVETTAVSYFETLGGVRIVMISGDHVRMPEGGTFAHLKIVGSTGHIDFDAFQEGYSIRSLDHPAGVRVDPPPRPGTGHQRHLDALADQIHASRPDLGQAERSLAALEACEAAYRSNRLGCVVHLPLASFRAPQPSDWDPGAPYAGSGGGRDGRTL